MPSILEKAKLALVVARNKKQEAEPFLSAEAACEVIFHGGVVEAQSSVLGETVYWVYGEGERRTLQAKYPRAVVYSWPELEQLVRSKTSAEQLRAYHLVKKVFNAKIDSIE